MKRPHARIFCRHLFLFVLLFALPDAYAHEYLLSIDAAAHGKFGLYYPVTYKFRLPEGAGPVTVMYRYRDTSAWNVLPERRRSDGFNGADGVRFDYPNRFAFISIRFAATSDQVWLRVIDQAGKTVDMEFDSIPRYYDDRKGAVAFSLDDYADWSYEEFALALDYLDSFGLRSTIGVIAGQVSNWSQLQAILDSHPDVEVASHGQSHACYAGAYLVNGYDAEVTGSRDLIRERLRFRTRPHLPVYVEPCGYSDDLLRASVTRGAYLVARSVLRGGGMAAWEPASGRYGRAPIIFEYPSAGGGDTVVGDANAAFDLALSQGEIYHLLDHPANGHWYPGSPLLRHLEHVRGRTDVWYVAVGDIYQYRFLQEGHGGLNVRSVADQLPQNRPPIADAGPDQSVSPGTAVRLDGSASADPDNDRIGYAWRQVQGPTVLLSGARTATPSFVAPETGEPLLFELTVFDATSRSAPAMVQIVVRMPTRTISTSSIGNGAIICSPGTTVAYGTSVACRASASTGYHMAEMTVDGNRQTVSGQKSFTYSFGAVTGDHALVATFAADTCQVQVLSSGNGTVVPSGNQQVDWGNSARFTLAPAEGYRITGASGCGGSLVGTVYTTGPVTAGCTVSVTFGNLSYAVSGIVAGAGGTISCAGRVAHGEAASCEIHAGSGFTLSALADNGADVLAAVRDNRYVIPSVVADHRVVATFGARSYTLGDTVKAQQLVLGKLPPSAADAALYDVAPLGPDGRPRPDGVVDVADVVIMLRRLVGILAW